MLAWNAGDAGSDPGDVGNGTGAGSGSREDGCGSTVSVRTFVVTIDGDLEHAGTPAVEKDASQ
jgi:hypothetical protein